MKPLSTSDASREILWNIPALPNQAIMYFLCFLSMLICGWGLFRRYKLWSSGKPEPQRMGNWLLRLSLLWENIFLQRRVNKKPDAKIFHGLILSGFVVLLFATTIVLIEHDFGIEIYRGRFYLAVSLLADIFGLLLFIGVCHALYRRYVQSPDYLHSSSGDFAMLVLLALLVLQGFALEGMRIAATNDPWALYSPVGYAVSLFFWSLSPPAIELLHFLMWWFHTLTVFAIIALLPYTKFLHIIASSANLFFVDLSKPKGALSYPGDIENLLEETLAAEDEEDFRIGVSTVADMTWKQRLDLDACTSCGRCQENCPAYNSTKPLSPKWMILDSRDHLLTLFAEGKLDAEDAPSPHLIDRLDQKLLKNFLLSQRTQGSDGSGLKRANNPLVEAAAKAIGQNAEEPLSGGVMEEDVFWSCTSCRACMEACPVGIEHVPLIMDVRRSMALMEGNIPGEAQTALRAIETRGNPFGPAESRTDWAEGLQVPLLSEGDEVDVLYWVGCVTAYDKQKQNIARSMTAILNASGLSWGILGEREHCSGDPARRLGEENLFQTSAKHNISVLKSVRFKTLVANCPHCFNTLKNEYPQIENFSNGQECKVLHHTQLIYELIESGKISVEETVSQAVSYHDACYLGRYNDVYEEPREILQCIGCDQLNEMQDSRESALCCGAGGGHYWFDMKVGERVNVMRIEQAAQSGAELVAVACPYCHQMLDDAVKLTEREQALKVQDLAELVAESLVSNP